jgi:histone deacetylase complex regulatory component SIN3
MNILKTVIEQLDTESKNCIIKYFNDTVYKKYSYFKDRPEIYENLMKQDPFYNEIQEHITQRGAGVGVGAKLDLYELSRKTLKQNEAKSLIKKWIESSCNKIYFINGYLQELVYDAHTDFVVKKILLKDNRVIDEYLNDGMLILTVPENYFILFIKIDNSSIGCISTLKNGFLDS